jgi:hypothetical protein
MSNVGQDQFFTSFITMIIYSSGETHPNDFFFDRIQSKYGLSKEQKYTLSNNILNHCHSLLSFPYGRL